MRAPVLRTEHTERSSAVVPDGSEVVLSASEFDSGHLDWYALDIANGSVGASQDPLPRIISDGIPARARHLPRHARGLGSGGFPRVNGCPCQVEALNSARGLHPVLFTLHRAVVPSNESPRPNELICARSHVRDAQPETHAYSPICLAIGRPWRSPMST
jgi:hypothetical protein